MDMKAIQMNEQLEPTAEEAAVYEILDAMKPGDWFYLPDGASGADAVFVVAAGQSRGLNLASQAERRFLVGVLSFLAGDGVTQVKVTYLY